MFPSSDPNCQKYIDDPRYTWSSGRWRLPEKVTPVNDQTSQKYIDDPERTFYAGAWRTQQQIHAFKNDPRKKRRRREYYLLHCEKERKKAREWQLANPERHKRSQQSRVHVGRYYAGYAQSPEQAVMLREEIRRRFA